MAIIFALKGFVVKKYLFLFFLFFLFSCVSTKDVKEPEFSKEFSKFNMPLKYKQDIRILADFKPSIVETSAKSYKQYFFYAWNAKIGKIKAKDVFWSFNGYLSKEYYFFNKQPIPRSFFEEAIENANSKDFLRLKQKALITKTTYLKNLPTNTPILLNPHKQGEGLPFDYALDSVLNVGTPVLISHFSKDRHYAFVRAESGWGFVLSADLEKFTDQRAKSYQNLNFITPLKEKTPVYDLNGNFAFETRIGAIYPYYDLSGGFYFGKIGSIKYKIPQNQVEKFPLKFSNEAFKRQMSQLINLPYGWGGYDYQRDCSLLTRDLFAPFGLYLPRNSYAQSVFWQRFDIKDLSDEEKLSFIKNYAKPYETLLYLKGHIMLYVGTVGGENVAFHSIWGIRSEDDGRLLIAKSALTSLDIGKNDKRVKKEDLILTRLEAISILNINPKEKQSIQEALSTKSF